MSLPITLESGLTLFDDDFYRGLGCMAGLVKTHEVKETKTDADVVRKWIDDNGGFGFAVSRTVKPGLFSYQRGIDGVTRSPWGHSIMMIGEDIGKAARLAKPSVLIPAPSTRWKNVKPGYPVPMVGGIPVVPHKYECVESKALVAVTDIGYSMDAGEQMVIFINPAWTREQKIAMAVEAYGWVGEPYDIFEIAHWVMPLVPNPAALKACSTLVLQIINAGDPGIKQWCKLHDLDPELVAPRDIFAWGIDNKLPTSSVDCTVEDCLSA